MFKNKKVIKASLLIALPVVLQNSITMVVNMLDTLMLSSYGEIQTTASSQANAFISIFQFLCMGIGNGGAVLTAQYWGANKIDELKKSISIMLKVGVVSSLVFSVVVLLFPETIMTIYSPDSEVVKYGAIYLLYSIPTFICSTISLSLAQVLRSIREVKIPLYASVISVITNFAGNWIFIFGNLGMPEMQIAGAAIGTVIARIVEMLILVIYILKVDKKLGFKFSDLIKKTEKKLLRIYMKFSVPVAISDLLLGLGNSATSVIIGHISTSYAAANSVVSMIQRIATVFSQGLGNAAHTIIGNTIGNKKYDEAQETAKTLLTMAFVFGVIAGLIIFGIGPIIINYFSTFSYETINIAYELLDALCIIVVFQALQSVITKGILRGGGDTEFCLKMDSTFLWLVSVPLGYLVGIELKMAPFFCIIALHADWFIKTAIGYRRILSKKWIKDIEN